jgi:hypothetical protein
VNVKQVVALIVTLAFIAPQAAFATQFEIQTEDFSTCHDVALVPIHKEPSPSCSGGYMLLGLDCPGEWAEYPLSVTDFGDWSVTLKCRGDAGVSHTFRLTCTGTQSGSSESIEITFVGVGYG